MKKKQKATNPAIITTIIIIIIIVCIIAVVVINPFASHQYGSYQIPTGYTKVIHNDKSATDGPDVTYYIYSDRVICETKNYLSVDESRDYTKTRTVIIYEGATSIEDIAVKTGREVANEHD
ncbi:MAG: hypothetical protein K5837_03750 [Candidatus Saccharibacteria bacterium]|nr:hypothetical protein [Candidatus Saccharibacteria bacterium]